MNAEPTPINAEVAQHNVLQVAKQIGRDLEKLPMETHAAVVAILQTLMQHRAVVNQNARQQELHQQQIRQALAIR